ncbi:MAG TPA: D-2-hydroxyacid dehydrogenase [Opitutaceae bacterium]|jgi:phosphoglycerate dehydrogenase-like enzyme
MSLTVWCNRRFRPDAERMLQEGLRGHHVIIPGSATAADVAPVEDATGIEQADVAFGQPPVPPIVAHPRIRWVQVSSAGYTRYDTPEFMEGMRKRGTVFTTSSAVFADPCAQHVMAMMLSLARQLPASLQDQWTDRSWHYRERRYESDLLTGQTVLLLGFGSIARRLAELLGPFRCKIYALRRQTRSVPGVHIVAEEDLTRVLPLADHIVSLLPDNERTRGWMNSRRLGCLKNGARFYNVGRGTTVDQRALVEALQGGRLGSAYLDVTEPEPLPSDHPLWTAPRCYITPHTAGGRRDQDEATVRHFLDNFAAFEAGQAMRCQVV